MPALADTTTDESAHELLVPLRELFWPGAIAVGDTKEWLAGSEQLRQANDRDIQKHGIEFRQAGAFRSGFRQPLIVRETVRRDGTHETDGGQLLGVRHLVHQ